MNNFAGEGGGERQAEIKRNLEFVEERLKELLNIRIFRLA